MRTCQGMTQERQAGAGDPPVQRHLVAADHGYSWHEGDESVSTDRGTDPALVSTQVKWAASSMI